MGGWTVLKEIPRQGQTLTIIIITVRKDDHKGSIALKNGANDYITKPFRFSDRKRKGYKPLNLFMGIINFEFLILNFEFGAKRRDLLERVEIHLSRG
ncbi:response regulator [Nostoc sp. 'Peltigera malacea cyanobiont' DB3992]|uniref:response regulator n=1 Tax=Nostoc sp. 'Peltigera malacea cyanobiont' DB3992 TaxID=1206980 RepID=UPI00211E79F1|nr:response regulator [Nostoc sp. 'Peltigera malacea cyanobiont' DB3992]